jgi:hypothetical protein
MISIEHVKLIEPYARYKLVAFENLKLIAKIIYPLGFRFGNLQIIKHLIETHLHQTSL